MSDHVASSYVFTSHALTSARSQRPARPLAVLLLAALMVLATALGMLPRQAMAQTGADRKVALVIGNAAYRVGPLKNPSNDARDMSAALRRLGFEVIERHNATREQMAFAVREYGDRLRGASVGLFYFAGHGLQVRGRNFLVPVDADIAREDEVPYRGFDVNEALDKMDSARTPVNIVILDACRNNPFARSFRMSQVGLAQMDAPPGTLIAFATAPGSVAQDGDGRNGLYTAALLRHIDSQSLAVEQMFKRVRVDVSQQSRNQQIPWESSSLNRDFSFASAQPVASAASAAPAVNAAAANATAAAAAAATDAAIDLAFWESVRNSTRREDFQAYLDQFPAGRFAALARLRVQGGPPAGAAPGAPATVAAVPAPNAPQNTTQHATQATVQAPFPRGSAVRGDDAGRLSFTTWGGGMGPFDLGTRAAVQALAVSPEARLIAAVSGGAAHLVDARDGAVVRRLELPPEAPGHFTQARFSPDGRWLMLSTTAQPHRTVVLDIGTGKTLWQAALSGAEFDLREPAVRAPLGDGRVQVTLLP